MKDIAIANTRNFTFMGHTGSGKTTLIDGILFKLGVNDRYGATADGSSMSDWSDEEKEHKITIWAKPFLKWLWATEGLFISKPLVSYFQMPMWENCWKSGRIRRLLRRWAPFKAVGKATAIWGGPSGCCRMRKISLVKL